MNEKHFLSYCQLSESVLLYIVENLLQIIMSKLIYLGLFLFIGFVYSAEGLSYLQVNVMFIVTINYSEALFAYQNQLAAMILLYSDILSF